MELMQYLEKCAETTGIKTEGEAKVLASILQGQTMKQAMGEIARELNARDVLTVANLHTEKGLTEARFIQAEIKGMFAVIERLLALTEIKDELEETK